MYNMYSHCRYKLAKQSLEHGIHAKAQKTFQQIRLKLGTALWLSLGI